MLAEITIRNFAIIDELTVEFGTGMTVLSGETGAGKSILVDALNLILGDRADADAVRETAERADLSARFVTPADSAAGQWLAAHELDDDGECVIRRTIAREGRSRCWVNGAAIPARELKTLGETLVDIHGQHAHQSLLRHDTQRALLDAYADHPDTLMQVAQAARQLADTRTAIAHIEQTDESGDMRIDLLRYQADELRALALDDDELEALEVEHKRLAGAERLIADGQQALGALLEAEDGAAVDRLGMAERIVGELTTIDDGFREVSELTTAARIQAQEAADALRRRIDALDIDPQRLREVEQRLASIQDIARKHHVEPAELPALLQRLEAELVELEGAGQRLAQLKEDEAAQLEAWRGAAQKLSYQRRQAAEKLGSAMTEIVRTLGMPEAQLSIDVTPGETERVAANGNDQIEFLLAANPGQNSRPLARVASGGELSRVSLAIEVVAAHDTRVPTRVFDEVDAGIGGGVAEIVGRQLRTLGQTGQSLCVTHLPQIAALADHHLHVAKHVENGATATRIAQLDADGRVEEMARMLGGVEITAQTRAHANDMIAQARATQALGSP